MHSVRSTHLSLKYLMFTPSGCKDIKIRKFEFAAKTSTQVYLELTKTQAHSRTTGVHLNI